ncbi:sugar ABC transporter permease [Pendulispora rubella]|uniref:Xylose transport system permease protein XylH n=1 Tax=Pendulispora rubella TaxID=2741070 RepID=A0ABZ2LGK1_9BACT
MSTEVKDSSSAAPAAVDPRLLVRESGVKGYIEDFQRRLKGGDLGALPVAIGLVIIWVTFYSLNENFLSPQNLSNLALQIAATGTISVGIVLVLLLGEIDLAVGSVSGLTGAVLAVLNVNQGMSAGVAILAALVAGAIVGAIHGFFFARVGVPSFIVTLAGLIGWQGLQLYVLGKEGTINLPYEGGVAMLTHTFFPHAVGFAIGAVIVAVYLLLDMAASRRRAKAGLPSRPISESVIRALLIGVAIFVAVYVLNQAEGLPLALVLFIGFVAAFDWILRRTRYGRMIFAVGGNAEAASRAGINVRLVRISVYVLSSTMGAAGGVMAASRLFAVNQSSGGNNELLNAIAAAVIGGTSLFGGRGSTYSALLGMLVIGSISNGMYLVQLDSSVQFMITGAVLLAAVVIDSVSRRGRQSSGRA